METRQQPLMMALTKMTPWNASRSVRVHVGMRDAHATAAVAGGAGGVS